MDKVRNFDEPDDINEIRELLGLKPKGYTAYIESLRKFTKPDNINVQPKSELVIWVKKINRLIAAFSHQSIDEDVESWKRNWFKEQLTALRGYKDLLMYAETNAPEKAAKAVNMERLLKAHKWLIGKGWIDTSEQTFISLFTGDPSGKVIWKGKVTDCWKFYYFLSGGACESETDFKAGLLQMKPGEINARFEFPGGKVRSDNNPGRTKTTRTSLFKTFEKACI